MEKLILKNISKKFDKLDVIQDLNLSVKKGELISLLGPSGCGKSTTLRIISGFLSPDGGEVFIDNENVTQTPPNNRDTSLVFQNYALFPHMTVFENVAYGLKIRKIPKKDIKVKVHEYLSMVKLEKLHDRYPGQLSGGQQQRVALSRALVVNPQILLLDEPLSNLDAKLREEMRNEIRNIQQELGLTSIFVTHDQEEALVLSDRVVVMEQGEIRQIGTPSEIFDSPESYFTADFVGVSNFYDGHVEGEVFITDKGLQINLDKNYKVTKVGIRPNMIVVNPDNSNHYINQYMVKVNKIIYKGTIIELKATFNSGDTVIVEIPSEKYKLKSIIENEEVNIGWGINNVLPLFQ